jgi:sucrose synthase
MSEFEGRPDLIIGNYSDGNLVASLLSDKLDVIQCTIAHALEKTKYAFSDLNWQENEKNTDQIATMGEPAVSRHL